MPPAPPAPALLVSDPPTRSLRNDFGGLDQWQDERGVLHRDGAPAEITYHPDGRINEETYYRHGKKHRTDGPAIVRHPGGGRTIGYYFQSDKLSRLDGPAVIECAADGKVLSERWEFWSGDYDDGAAVARGLLNLGTEDAIRDEVARTVYADLVSEDVTARQVVELLAEGVSTVEGMREVLGGAPVEWVRNFEMGLSKR